MKRQNINEVITKMRIYPYTHMSHIGGKFRVWEDSRKFAMK